jgi:hypothetical protein
MRIERKKLQRVRDWSRIDGRDRTCEHRACSSEGGRPVAASTRRLGLKATSAALVLMGLVSASPVPGFAADGSWPTNSGVPPIRGVLYGLAGTTTSDEWAVGAGSTGTLIMHGDSGAWTQVPSPSPSRDSDLIGVAASSENVWAVGSYLEALGPATISTALVEQWNGAAWSQSAVPSPGSCTALNGVAAAGADGAIAVGYTVPHATTSCGRSVPFAIVFDGTTWKRTTCPIPPGGSSLNGVSALSTTRAMAVGSYVVGSQTFPLILRRDGSKWSRMAVPRHTNGTLWSVTELTASNAWAVGDTAAGKTLIMHWNGSKWRVIPSPTRGRSDVLLGVAATSSKLAWAVGSSGSYPNTSFLMERWNGKRWSMYPSPKASSPSQLTSIVAPASGTSAAPTIDGFTGSRVGGSVVLKVFVH